MVKDQGIVRKAARRNKNSIGSIIRSKKN